jgi:hypothetical protein
MKKAFDITSVRMTLRDGIAKGYWTLEQLDQPSWGWRENAKSFRLHYPKCPQLEYVNPLRDPEPEPVVQISEPRDFTPTEGATPAQPLDLEVDW